MRDRKRAVCQRPIAAATSQLCPHRFGGVLGWLGCRPPFSLPKFLVRGTFCGSSRKSIFQRATETSSGENDPAAGSAEEAMLGFAWPGPSREIGVENALRRIDHVGASHRDLVGCSLSHRHESTKRPRLQVPPRVADKRCPGLLTRPRRPVTLEALSRLCEVNRRPAWCLGLFVAIRHSMSCSG